MRGDVQAPLTIILAMVMLVIGMAVVNVASLLLVRAAARAREISVRYALGATSRQVLRQLLAEGMILGLAGAALGLAIAPEALRLLIHRLSSDTPDALPFTATLNWDVLGWSLLVTMVASLLFSLAPALQFRNPQAGGGNAAAVGDQRRWIAEVSPHVRRAADWIQLAADCCGGDVCEDDQ